MAKSVAGYEVPDKEPEVYESAEDRINDPQHRGKVGFGQQTAFRALDAAMNSKANHYHVLYNTAKNKRLRVEERKRKKAEEVRKACDPDQLTQFVTTFKLKSIKDQKLEAATTIAAPGTKFDPIPDDIHRPEYRHKWKSKNNFTTISHRLDKHDMLVAAAKWTGNMMTQVREEEQSPPKIVHSQPWLNRVPDQCNKWENMLARIRVATDQINIAGAYEVPGNFQHKTLATGVRPFVTKFFRPDKATPLDGTPIPLLTATETEIMRRPKFEMYPFGWEEKSEEDIRLVPKQLSDAYSAAKKIGKNTNANRLRKNKRGREQGVSRASITSSVALFSRTLLDTRASEGEEDTNTGRLYTRSGMLTNRTIQPGVTSDYTESGPNTPGRLLQFKPSNNFANKTN